MLKTLTLVLFVLVLGLQTAVAGISSEDSQFKKFFREANEAFKSEDYERALAALQRAYKQHTFPRLHHNMAQCFNKMGRLKEELDQLNLLLSTDPDLERNQKLRDEVQNRVNELRSVLRLDQTSAQEHKRPVHKRWWLWTTVASVATGAVVGVLAWRVKRDLDENTPMGTEVVLKWTAPITQTAGFQLRF